MEVEHILLEFGLILGAGLLSQLAATLLRVPEMIVLVAVGALIGPSVLAIASNLSTELVPSSSSRWACR